MKLSDETLVILKNFSEINSGIVIEEGNVLSTIHPNKVIMGSAVVKESFPFQIRIYALGDFLSILSEDEDLVDLVLDKDDQNQITIVGHSGKSKVKYRLAAPNLIISPPKKALVLPSKDLEIKLDEKDLNWVLRMADILHSPNIIFRSDGKTLSLVTMDIKNDSAHEDTVELGKAPSGTPFEFVFKRENWKMLPKTYDVTVTAKGMAHFKANNLQYWVTTEKETWFGEKKQGKGVE